MTVPASVCERRIAFHTLGCRLNLYETDALVSRFTAAGYTVTVPDAPADVYVINTCTVTRRSDQKSRHAIKRIINALPPASGPRRPLVVVTGCMVGSDRERLERNDAITYVVDNERKPCIFDLVEAHFRGEMIHPNRLTADVFNYPLGRTTLHTRSLVKIQDGCDNHCTFCIIPSVRGRAVSRPVTAILKNIRQLLEVGYKEIVLTGVNMGRYRAEHGGRVVDLADLVRMILEGPGDFRLRLSSLEPDPEGIDRDAFYDLFQHDKMCPHLHLCLQSGSDRILLHMRRQYGSGQFLQMVETLRSKDPHFNLTTDVMVGFPGETEEDFRQTLEVATQAAFSHIHTFPYSRRASTRAARMTDQVPEAVKKERAEIVRSLSTQQKRRYRQTLLGRPHRVLFERRPRDPHIHPSHAVRGYSEYYVPIESERSDPAQSINTWAHVTPSRLSSGDDPVLLA